MADAAIPLAVRPPQIANPVEEYGKLLSLKNLQAQSDRQSQLFPEQLKAVQTENQARDLENQARQRAMDSQRVMTQAWIDSKGHLDDAEQLAIQRGALPSDVMALRKNRLEQAKELAATQKDNLANLEKGGDLLAGRTDAFLASPNREKDWPAYWDAQEKDKLITPEQHAAIIASAPKYPGDDAVRNLGYGFRSHSQLAKDAQAVAETNAANARTDASKSTSALNNLKASATRRDQAITELSALDPKDAGGYLAWAAQHPELKPPATYSEDWVKRQVRSAVPAEKQPQYDLTQLKVDNGVVGTDKFESVFLPAYAANLGKTVKQLTPAEKMASFTVFKQYDQNPEMLQSLLATRQMTQAMHNFTMGEANFRKGQQSYQFHAGELDRLAKPIEESVARFSRLQDTLNQNTPQADALVAPELLSVMAGGQGSGLRMNEAEIARIVGGRSKWESLKADINKWQLDNKKANSITPEQRQEIRALTAEVGKRLSAKQDLITGARQGLAGTNDPMEHRTIMSGLHEKLLDTDKVQQVGNNSAARQYVRTANGPNGHQIGQTADGAWYDTQTGAKVQ